MNYSAALQAALERFRTCSLEEMSRLSGYSVEGEALSVQFLGKHYKVGYPDGNFSAFGGSGELSVTTQILILHYLTNLNETSERGELISFKELPGGDIYFKPFTHRTIEPMIRIFGSHPEKLLEAGALLGGQLVGLGDVGVRIRVFPRISVTFVLWRADDEFPASGNILFDKSAPALLPTEDYAVLASVVLLEMKRLSEGEKSNNGYASHNTPEPIL